MFVEYFNILSINVILSRNERIELKLHITSLFISTSFLENGKEYISKLACLRKQHVDLTDTKIEHIYK